MMLMAGAFCRTSTGGVQDDLRARLAAALSRHPLDTPAAYTAPNGRWCVVTVAAERQQRTRLHVDATGALTVVAGDPYLDPDTVGPLDRKGETEVVHAALASGRWSELQSARGVFCAAHLSHAEPAIILAADKLGIRPIYYWVGPELVVFASALRVLEDIAEVPKRMCLRGAIETMTLGVPLADRTVFADISLLHAGEVVRIEPARVSRARYWRWDDVAPSSLTESEAATEAYALFNDAVNRRLDDERSVAAFLSGGLDSRVITAELRRRELRVHTFNFARPGTQDFVLGRQFAAAAGTVHHELPIVEKGANAKYAFTMAAAMARGADLHPDVPQLSRRAWSGDGGSIGVGHVRVDPQVVFLLRRGESARAVALFIDQQRAHVPRRLFRRGVAEQVGRITADGIHEELTGIHSQDPGRGFHLFLMLNDQRRHLADHFEHLDLHRIEYQLPFFDSSFLELVVSLPLDLCIGHRFYMRWLDCFPTMVRSVPWQTYPGHVPCPLPPPADLQYQWGDGVLTLEDAGLRKRVRIRAAASALANSGFPHPLLHRGRSRLALWLYRLGIRDYSYALDYLVAVSDLWRRGGGQFALTGTRTRASRIGSDRTQY
jgi:asparagine synthase (glutamine-hydrolysing)